MIASLIRCAAERKVLEKALRLLFTSGDISAVKAYVLRQCDKLQCGRASLLDLVFANEVRRMTADYHGWPRLIANDCHR